MALDLVGPVGEARKGGLAAHQAGPAEIPPKQHPKGGRVDGPLVGEVHQDGLGRVHAGADDPRLLRGKVPRVVEGVREPLGPVGVGHAGGVEIRPGVAQGDQAILGRLPNEGVGVGELRGHGQELYPLAAEAVELTKQLQIR